ncbi:protease inhibitor I42 family protein [Kitasatospora azatica]|uniref:protease inhibitor I42 family protein n=1 Tax=Kitasatospora azatica TaxID=58347 RepID=UPI0005620345|nr:protease inhibitor I42 family protein [Kitasatospora azatica]
MRRSLGLFATAALLLTGCQVESGGMNHGQVFAFGTSTIDVKPGQTFSLHQKLAVVPGSDDWQVVDPRPDPAVLGVVGTDRIKPAGGQVGDGGEVYLVFKAAAKGTTEVVLENCLSCTGALKQTYHSHNTYRVVVG